MRLENKAPFDFLFSQQHVCQKLPKSVYARGSYSAAKLSVFGPPCEQLVDVPGTLTIKRSSV